MHSDRHSSDDDLVLAFYSEPEAAGVRAHLAACPSCRQRFDDLTRVLDAAGEHEVPARGPAYGAEVWRRLQPALRASQQRVLWWHSFTRGAGLSGPPVSLTRRLAFAGGIAALVVAAFFVGRLSPREGNVPSPAAVQTGGVPIAERVLLVAVGEHLDRSQLVLLELLNADPAGEPGQRRVSAPIDISMEQERARELVDSNRLYRQTAAHSGEVGLESLLDELEPILLEIAHGPSELSAEDLAVLRQRIEDRGVLFKVRIVGARVRERQRETAASAAAPVS